MWVEYGCGVEVQLGDKGSQVAGGDSSMCVCVFKFKSSLSWYCSVNMAIEKSSE